VGESVARKKLGELLREGGLIDDVQLASALGQQRQWGGRLGSILVRMRLVSEQAIVETISRQLRLPVARLLGWTIDPDVLALVPQEICERHQLLPYARTRTERGIETLHVAMSDPTNLPVIDDLAFRTGKRIDVAVAAEREVELAIRHNFYGEPYSDQVRVTQLAGASFRGREIDLRPAEDKVPPRLVPAAERSVVVELGESDVAIDEEFERVPQLAPVAPPANTNAFDQLEPLVVTGGGAEAAPQLRAVEAQVPLSLRERLLAQTIAAELGTDGVPDRQLLLALARLLIRKGVIGEDEWIAEVARK
jgi:hypothetical protein